MSKSMSSTSASFFSDETQIDGDQTRKARLQFAENKALASFAAVRAYQKQKDAIQAKAARDSAMKESHLKAKQLIEQSEAEEAEGERQKNVRRLASPATSVQPAKRARIESNLCMLAWGEAGNSFVDLALQEGATKPTQIPKDFAHDSVCDGLVIVCEGDSFVTKGLEPCPWHRGWAWRELASTIDARETSGSKIRLSAKTDSRIKLVNSGTFNVVVKVEESLLPSWVPNKTVLRISRPDIRDQYLSEETVASEVENAMYASSNGFGVKVHVIAPFQGIRHGRSLRYGTVYVLDEAESDLSYTLSIMHTQIQGMREAKNAANMLFRASRCGIAFFDIKPANILCMQDGLKLTDFDPAFFVVNQKADWRALLLLNLALLSCHVRNAALGSVSWGWATSVKPLLTQLISRRDEYDSDWIFGARSVNIPFDSLICKSDFGMQRMLSVMTTSYFYGKSVRPRDVSSLRWRWETRDQAALDAHWSSAANLESWPSSWTNNYTPLITQMVEFAVERAS